MMRFAVRIEVGAQTRVPSSINATIPEALDRTRKWSEMYLKENKSGQVECHMATAPENHLVRPLGFEVASYFVEVKPVRGADN